MLEKVIAKKPLEVKLVGGNYTVSFNISSITLRNSSKECGSNSNSVLYLLKCHLCFGRMSLIEGPKAEAKGHKKRQCWHQDHQLAGWCHVSFYIP